MIEVENLSKRYGEKLAVDGLDFVVQPGIVTGFLGPNGAGKSTTMRMIAGLDEPTAQRPTRPGRRPTQRRLAARFSIRRGRASKNMPGLARPLWRIEGRSPNTTVVPARDGSVGRVCPLAAVSRRVTLPVTRVSPRVVCFFFRAAGPGRGWGAAGGAW